MGLFDTVFGSKKKKLEASLQTKPTVENVLELAKIYIKDDDLSSALRLLRVWCKNFNDPELKVFLKETEELERKREIEGFERRIKDTPNSLNYSRLASLILKSGDVDRAKKICEESLQKFPEFNAGAHQCLGDIHLLNEDYKSAAVEYENVVLEDSNNVQVVKKLCEIYIYNGNSDKAIHYLDDLVHKNPGDQAIKDMLESAKAGKDLSHESNEPEPQSIEESIPDTAKVPPEEILAPPIIEQEVPIPSPSVMSESKLMVTDPKGMQSEIPLVKTSFVIGRHKAADLCIDDGRSFISRKHAEFSQDNDNWIITDLGSGNGTYVNGAKITKHSLIDNDVVKIGLYTIVFKCTNNGANDPEMTMLEDSDATIVGQDFSYSSNSSDESGDSVDLCVNKIAEIGGVKVVLVINASGFPVHSKLNDTSFNEEALAAVFSHISNMITSESSGLGVEGIQSSDIQMENLNSFLYLRPDFTISVLGDKSCKKGLIEMEVQKLLEVL